MNDMPDAKELLHSNLHDVFSERDPERRQAAIERTYTEDVRFIDPAGESVGQQALSDRAQKLLDGFPADFVHEEDGPEYVGTDTAVLAWRFGPPAHPVARGIDILTIRDGRVSVVRTLLAPETVA
jgi:SnoaL-like domain